MSHRPRKRFGQNFLHDQGVIERILGYVNPQPGEHLVEIGPGQHYNPYFPGDMAQVMKPEYMHDGHPVEGVEAPLGGVLAMAPPLADGIIEYGDGSPQTAEQYAKDVTEFLMWAAEPKLEARKSLGVMTIIYLIILAGLLYWSYRKIWSDVDH